MIRIQIKSKPTFRQASQLAGRFASQRRRLIFEEFDWASLAPAIAMAVTEVFDTEGYGRVAGAVNPDYAAWKSPTGVSRPTATPADRCLFQGSHPESGARKTS